MLLKLRYFTFTLIVIVLTSCVGTIEDTGNSSTEAEGTQVKPISYAGIVGVKAISDTKVEIYFPPAPGDQRELVYQIYKDMANQPIEVRFDALRKSYEGNLTYTYSGLEPSRTYSFSVEFKNLVTNRFSRSSNGTLTVDTFSNQMCNFNGIIDARNAVGTAATDTVNVYWFPALDSGYLVSSEDYDPEEYEIIGITEEDGGLDRIEDITANRIVENVSSSKSFHPITGLTPGTKYYFQVRCKHRDWKNKGYIDLQETMIGTYRRETNSRFIEIETKANGSEPDFLGPFEIVNPLIPNDANSKLGVKWEPATGGFEEYRVFYWKRDPGAPLSLGVYDEASMMAEDKITDLLMDEMVNLVGPYPSGCNPKNDQCGHIKVPAGDISATLDGLDKYSYYQVKVVACVDTVCDTGKRIALDSQLGRVVPNMVPFNGITSIAHPNPTVDVNRISLQFLAPLRDSGYATRLVVKCFQGADDSTPVSFPENLSAITGSGKSECDGLSLNTTLPNHSAMLNFTKIEIDGVDVNTNTNYCFAVYPEISETGAPPRLDYVLSDEQNAIISCISPQIKGPTLQEFAGRRENVCEFDDTDPSNLRMKVKWFEPDGGFWENFRVFWKEYDPTSTNPDIAGAFNFQKAIDTANQVGSVYLSANAAGSTAKEYLVASGLQPGKKYHIGVLPYFQLGGVDQFGEFNTATRECAVPYPKAIFNEWTNVLAVGPKVDGRSPAKHDDVTDAWSTTRIFETLTSAKVPEEVQMDAPNSITPVDANLLGSSTNLFNGVYGKKDANDNISEGPHRYSNSGIVHLEFKDLLIDHRDVSTSYYDDKTTFHTLREFVMDGDTTKFTEMNEGWEDGETYGVTPAHKRNRKIGYKIFRSHDNQKTWVDLTQHNEFLNPFQTDDNEGLIYSTPVTYFKINGRGRTTERRVQFTDYSVKHYEDVDGIVSRGRVYWYKVVPYIDGVPLEYKDAESNPHHVLRVVLPPPNMAFVSRLMANRQACIELGKESLIRKGAGQYYSCPYNGIGAVGMQKPWSTTATFYDMGGDLLVDRYELGCNWSRGDMTDGAPDSSLSDSVAGNDTLLFGLYKNFTEDSGISGSPMKGCFQVGSQYQGFGSQYSNSEPTNYGPNGGGETEFSYKQVIPGDCFGSGESVIYNGSYERCAEILGDGGNPDDWTLQFPGAFTPAADDYRLIGDCLRPYTAEYFNRDPSLPFDNTTFVPTNGVENMDPYAAHSEFGAVFYRRTKQSSGNSGYIRTLQKYFSANDSGSGQKRFLDTGARYDHSSCSINLYGVSNLPLGQGASTSVSHTTNIRPRWLSIDEMMRDIVVREANYSSEGTPNFGGAIVETISDLYSWKLSKVIDPAQSELYGGDWQPPSHIQAIVDERINADMTLARIMTSNASKLPAIEALTQPEYNKLCQQYTVEIGYTDSQDSFVRTFPESDAVDPLKKRLPRRSEFVAFSAWPDRYGEATVLTLEGGVYDDGLADILAALNNADATETGTAFDPSSTGNADEIALVNDLDDLYEPNGCNTLNKHTGNSHTPFNFYDVDLGANGVDRFRDLHPTFPYSRISSNPFYWSGSSRLDSSNYNSEKCISRYGIQDSVGNVREVGSDKFWCDPAAHDFKLTAGGNEINLQTHGFNYFREDLFPTWADQVGNIGVKYGECSVRARGNDDGDAAAVGGNMVSIYTDFTKSNYNTGLLPELNSVDPESVLYMRNGADGEFLSFGANEVLPPLYRTAGNNLTLTTEANSNAGYFSPVLGMPIRCAGLSCATSADNQLITNPLFYTNLQTAQFGNVLTGPGSCNSQIGDTGFPITNCDFPFGNGNIKNFSTHEYYTNTHYLYTSAGSSQNSNLSGDFSIADFYVNADGSGPVYASEVGTIGLPTDGDMNGDGFDDGDTNTNGIIDGAEVATADGRVDSNEYFNWIDNLVDPGELSTPNYIYLVTIQPRNRPAGGIFISGGSAESADTEDKPGRYGLDITMDSIYHQEYKTGARCVVKVYGSDY